MLFVLISLNYTNINKDLNDKARPANKDQMQIKPLVESEPLKNLKEKATATNPPVKSISDLIVNNITAGESSTAVKELNISDAIELLNEGKEYKAIAILQKIIANDPKNHKALNQLGRVYMNDTYELDKAKYFLQKAVKLRPNYKMYVLMLSTLYIETGEIDIGLKFVQKHLDENPESSALSTAYGNLLSSMGNDDEAINHFEKAAVKSKNQFTYYVELATLYDSKGDTQKAVDSIAKAVSALKNKISNKSNGDKPKIATLKWSLGFMNKEYARLLFKNKDFKQAQIEVNKIDAASPHNKDYDIIKYKDWLKLKNDIKRASSNL